MRESWLTPQWNGRRRIDHPVNWARFPEFDVGVAFVQTKADHGHENRWYLYVRKFNEADVQTVPVLASTVITSSPGTTQTIISDATWNLLSNSIEVIGAGARGAHGASTSTSGGGGGGGAYTRILNTTITTPGTTPMYVRVGGTTATDGSAGGDSWWTLSSPGTTYPTLGATACAAKGGTALASATTATGSTGGQSSGSYPAGGGELARSGGTGANAGGSNAAGGGGGGAAGQVIGGNGSGTTGGAGASGGSPAGGNGGGPGNPGVAGSAGTNIQTGPNAGSGGGGGGGNAGPSTGGAGGLYGGGGGGGGRSNGTGGQGAQGVIVLTWTPIFTGTFAATEAADVAAFPGGVVAWNAVLAATEAADIAAFTGLALQPVTGSLAVTEAAEIAALTGSVAWDAVLAASEDTTYELLLHLDGTDASTTMVDSGGKNQTVTAHGAAQIDADQAVFAGQALLLSADSDYLSVDTGDFAFGTGDFCVDLRTRVSSATVAQLFFDGGASGFQLLYDGSVLKFTSAAGSITGSGLSADTNYHLAATRGAGSTRLWKDGVQQGSTLTDATSYAGASGYPRIGGAPVTSVAGILAATEASDTAALTGSLGIMASLAATEANDTASFTGAIAVADVTAGRTLWYKFDDTTTTDSSGNSNTGTIAGSGTTLVTGHIDSALSFNGSGYVSLTSISPFVLASATSEISVCCWVKLTATDGVICAMRDGSGTVVFDFVVGYNAVDNAFTGKPSLIVRDGAGGGLTYFSASTAVNDGNWHHVAWTRTSGKVLTLYIDGTAAGTATDTMGTGSTPLVTVSAIGRDPQNGGLPWFNGLMDDFRVYNRALTSTEVATLASQ